MTPPLLKSAVRRTSTFRALLEQLDREIEALSPAALRVIAPALDDLRTELTRDIGKWLTPERWDGLRNGYAATRTAEMRAQIERAIRRATALTGQAAEKLGRAEGDALAQFGPDAARMGGAHLVRVIEAREGVFGEAVRMDVRSAAALAEPRRKLLVERYKPSRERWGTETIQEIRAQLVRGVLRNETFAQLTTRLLRLGRKPGEMIRAVGAPAIEAAAGLWRQQRGNVERLVRTEMIRCYGEEHDRRLREAAKADPELMAIWDAANDSRTCVECRSADGEVRPVGGTWMIGGREVKHQPAHPRCRCRVVPHKPRWTRGG